MNSQAKGTFEVKLTPQDDQLGTGISRMLIEKQFQGGLEGLSKGQMLAAGNPASGSGGYVAIEEINGSLLGRNGTFVLQHIGTMNQGATAMSITVVPGTGTDELAGLDGRMMINIVEGNHFYEFNWTLPEPD